jgi:hypothetical protein
MALPTQARRNLTTLHQSYIQTTVLCCSACVPEGMVMARPSQKIDDSDELQEGRNS